MVGIKTPRLDECTVNPRALGPRGTDVNSISKYSYSVLTGHYSYLSPALPSPGQGPARTIQSVRMLELCKVTDWLFISNARSACSTELLQQEAVTQCINVSRQQPFPSATLTQLRISVFDDPNEDLYVHFDTCADAIEAEGKRGGKTVVYCKNGRSRSASVCAAYLLKYQQLTVEGALQKVKAARNVIDPNPGFLSQLQRYEEELRRRREQG